MTTTPADAKTTPTYELANPSMLVLVPVGMAFITIGNFMPIASKQMTLLLTAGAASVLIGFALRFIVGIVRGIRIPKAPDFDANAYKAAVAARKKAHKDWGSSHKSIVTYIRAQSIVVLALWVAIIVGSNSGNQNEHTAAAVAGCLWLGALITTRVISKATKRPRY